jgi:hypothetical protein
MKSIRSYTNFFMIGLTFLTLIFPIPSANRFFLSSKPGQNDAPSVTSPNILFEDDFNGGDAAGWTISGPGSWYVANGEYVIDMGTNYNSVGASMAGDMNWTNYTFEMDVKGDIGTDKGMLFRCTDIHSSCYFVNLRGDPLNDMLFGNAGIVLASVSYPNTTGIWYHLKVDLIGAHIKVYVNNQPQIDYTAGSPNLLTQGEIGLAAVAGGTSDKVHFDNVMVIGAFSSYLPVVVK